MDGSRKQWFAGGFLIAIMVMSTLGYVLGSSADTTLSVKYNEYTFKNTKNLWTAKVQGKERMFAFLPQDVGIDNASILQLISSTPVLAVSYDPNSTLVESLAEAQYRLEQEISSPTIIRGITQPTGNIAVITCKNASTTIPVLILQEGNTTRFSQDNNCIIAEAISEADVARITDRILYTFLGVMS